MHKKYIEYAKKTFVAYENPYNSVVKTFGKAINKLEPNSYYYGIKDIDGFDEKIFEKLDNNNFIRHTIDKSSYGGRAIDINLKNPITGRNMTGSSSGTAINVFAGINDLGIGSDGGGSVLAPAASLNLFGFLSPLIPSKFKNKKSTDNLGFKPSVGFISKKMTVLEKAVEVTLDISLNLDKVNSSIIINTFNMSKYYMERIKKKNINANRLIEINTALPRKEGIRILSKYIKNNILIGYESKIDLEGFGDSIFGLNDSFTKKEQEKANKGIIKYVNMCGLSAIFIPTSELASGYILCGDSSVDTIREMFHLGALLYEETNPTMCNYFGNLDMYLR
ncbi:MAG: amidase family protein [Miniphocaeibacter sp.]|uniref:amidase family protein n=1 Tax=Miniphocaeibacter sp. TaxID=3100973 RepID=UPI0017D6823B|nr:hypothetical protein [Gallicola sp.]